MLPGVGAAPDADDAGDLGMYSLTKPEASHAIWANPAKNLGTQARRV
jgi:hypothetical protein